MLEDLEQPGLEWFRREGVKILAGSPLAQSSGQLGGDSLIQKLSARSLKLCKQKVKISCTYKISKSEKSGSGRKSGSQ